MFPNKEHHPSGEYPCETSTCRQPVGCCNRLRNEQQVPSVLAVPRGVGPVVETARGIEKNSQRQNDKFSPSVVPQPLYFSAAFRKLNEIVKHQLLYIMQR